MLFSVEATMETVAVVGASPKAERYSHQAMILLEESGHNPIPIAPTGTEILGKKIYRALREVHGRIDTVTLYLRPSRQASVLEDAVRMKPSRIIFNPGTENPAEYDRLRTAGIDVIEACTLILLRSGRF
jgi:predicted CoA-binding protein